MAASVVEIDLGAIRHNVGVLKARAGDARLCAVVKADGYGHGATRVGRAALEAGAEWLAVAQVAEAKRLRGDGVDAPILLLSEPRPDEIDHALAIGLRLTVCRPVLIDAVAARASALGVADVPLHLKVDTGMRRIGCRPHEAAELAGRILAADRLRLDGTMTHLALADEPDDPTTDSQLEAFREVLDSFAMAGIDPGLRHAANSAATIAFPHARLDLVRVGIAMYGIPPSPRLAGEVDLRPALRWSSTVSMIKPVAAGDGVSYGHRHRFGRDSTVATVPVGYADGVRRRLGLVGGEVLIRGRRCPIVGVVTMDQLLVDCGPDADIDVGDEVVLIGTQGDDQLTANAIADLVDTIGYEIVCGISARVPREEVG